MHLHVHLPAYRRLARVPATVNARAEFHAKFSDGKGSPGHS
ncbi:Uncharacterised protein [Amycolatopsis camponoti]|uniref:Uncharacterized protein n=1 Tax=Amycolatopsis camponoti TaxID=2606593 RepID=A0A6I8M568_9PSEU|nr:Uncharacterised protein [Amycolatopsis camponoti]